MNTDQTIDEETIRAARQFVRTLGSDFIGNHWAESEVALYVHMLAGVVQIENYARQQGIDEKVVSKLGKEVMYLLLECAEAIRQSNRQLWSDFLPRDQEPPATGSTP